MTRETDREHQHRRSEDVEPRTHERAPDAPRMPMLDVRNWRLADVLALVLLVFNLGVTVTRLSYLEEWKRDHVALHERMEAAAAEAEKAEAARERVRLAERVAAFEAAARKAQP